MAILQLMLLIQVAINFSLAASPGKAMYFIRANSEILCWNGFTTVTEKISADECCDVDRGFEYTLAGDIYTIRYNYDAKIFRKSPDLKLEDLIGENQCFSSEFTLIDCSAALQFGTVTCKGGKISSSTGANSSVLRPHSIYSASNPPSKIKPTAASHLTTTSTSFQTTASILHGTTASTSLGITVPASLGRTVSASLGITPPTSYGIIVSASLGRTVPASLAIAASTSLGITPPTSYGIIASASLGRTVSASLGITVSASLGITVPASLGMTASSLLHLNVAAPLPFRTHINQHSLSSTIGGGEATTPTTTATLPSGTTEATTTTAIEATTSETGEVMNSVLSTEGTFKAIRSSFVSNSTILSTSIPGLPKFEKLFIGNLQNGGWGDWGNYSECSNICGGGSQVILRYCDNPSPRNGGKTCIGESSKSRRCNTTPCPGLMLATPGMQCKEFCNKSGLVCSSSISTGNSDEAFQNENITCSSDTSAKLWTKNYHPYYDRTTQKCEGYILVPSFVSCHVDSPIPFSVRRLCNCVDYAEDVNLSPWSPWADCTVSCGGGTRTRTRTCDIDNCFGETFAQSSCNSQLCPVNGGFSDWSAWSSCDKSCGGGRNQRNRTCTNPYPEYGGQECYGEYKESTLCNVGFCPVHGGWTSWTVWTACDKPCNTGSQRRFRFCENPQPLYGGSSCYGSNNESVLCNQRKCPAERVTVEGLHFNITWFPEMQTPGSEHFMNFTKKLELNIKRDYEFAPLANTFTGVSVKQLRSGSVIANFTMYFSSLDSDQLINFQDSLQTTLFLGKMPLISGDVIQDTTIVPAAPPENFTAHSTSPSTVAAFWGDVPLTRRNGIINGYIVFYKNATELEYNKIASTSKSVTIHGLDPYTKYHLRILAYTSQGNGVPSSQIEVMTMEKAPSHTVTGLVITVQSPTSLFLEWDLLPQEFLNGASLGYMVSYSTTTTAQSNVSVDGFTSILQLDFLQPSTNYIIEICAFNSRGKGPLVRRAATTLDSAPSISPPNVKIFNKTSHNSLDVQWHHIPLEYVHGDLIGYKIQYTQIQTGEAVLSDSNMANVSVGPWRTKVTLVGLKPYSSYQISVLAINHMGDGVMSAPLIASTCKCPPKIFTNFALSKPYIFRDHSGSARGIFAELLANITSYACGTCNRGINDGKSVLSFVSNGKNGWAEKSSLTEVGKDIDNSVHLSFPLYGKADLVTYLSYPYVPVIDYPGCVFYTTKESLSESLVSMIGSIMAVWPIFLMTVLMVMLSGIVFWFVVILAKSDELPKSFTAGPLDGMYWAWVTMGTHGYGDVVPKTIPARIFAIVWIFVGLVISAILTSALTSAFTAKSVVANEIIYDREIAAVDDSKEYMIGVLRNGKINSGANYRTVDEVAEALRSGRVKGALVDVFTAASRNDLFKTEQFIAKRVIKYPAAYGIVLSGDMQHVQNEFKLFLSLQANEITQMTNRYSVDWKVNVDDEVAVSPFHPDSALMRMTLIGLGTTLCLILLIRGIFDRVMKCKGNNRVSSDITSRMEKTRRIEELCNDTLAQMAREIPAKMNAIFERQLNDRVKFNKQKGLFKHQNRRNLANNSKIRPMQLEEPSGEIEDESFVKEVDEEQQNMAISDQNKEEQQFQVSLLSIKTNRFQTCGQIQVTAQCHSPRPPQSSPLVATLFQKLHF